MKNLNDLQAIIESRKNQYAFLSSVYFHEPPEEFLRDIRDEKFDISGMRNKEMRQGFELMGDYIQESKLDIKELTRELGNEYVLLFMNPVKSEIRPYQSVYEGNEPYGKTALFMKKKYAEAGVMKTKDVPESEDHIGVELGFMYELCKKELEAAQKNRSMRKYLVIQKDFLDNNLLKWVPRLRDDILHCKEARFYKGIAMLTSGFLSMDRVVVEELLSIA